MLNQREQIALLLLIGALVAGSVVAVVDYCRPGAVEDLRVVPAAVPCPVVVGSSPSLPDVTPASPAPLGVAQAPRIVALNSASAAELETLPGVGPKMAARILDYRRRNGPFARVGELQRVRGIGPRTLRRLRPLVKARAESVAVDSGPSGPGGKRGPADQAERKAVTAPPSRENGR